MALLPAAWTRSLATQKLLDFVSEDDRPAPVAAPEPVAAATPVLDAVARRLLLLQQ